MTRISFSKADISRGKPVEPGWYAAEIVKYEEKPANTDGSTNFLVTYKIIQGGPFNDFEVTARFNEKAKGFMVQFISTLVGQPVSEDEDYVLSDAIVGRQMDIFIKNRDYEGRPQNEVTDYRVIGK